MKNSMKSIAMLGMLAAMGHTYATDLTVDFSQPRPGADRGRIPAFSGKKRNAKQVKRFRHWKNN